ESLKRRRQRAASKRYYLKMADRCRALGICIGGKYRGQPRKYKTHYFECHGTARARAITGMKRDAFAAQGLNCDGTRRKLPMRHRLPRALDRQTHNANAVARSAIYRARNIAAGLTSKGKPRKDGLAPRTDLELRWRE